MFRHDPPHSAVSPYGDPVPNPPAWKYQVGGGLSSPVIGDNGDGTSTIYIGGGSGYLCALNMDGSLKWAVPCGISRSTPCVGPDGTIYVGGNSGGYCLLAVNPDGTIKWAYGTSGEITSSPAIADGVIYVADRYRYLHAVDASTGTRVWRYNTGGGVHMCSPCVGPDGTVYIGGGSYRLHAVDGTTGSAKWVFQTGSNIMSSPAMSPDGSRVYVGSCDGYMYAINTADGTKAWQVPVPLIAASTSPSPAVAPDGTIYIGSNGTSATLTSGTVHAIAPNGVPIWEYQTTFDIRSSPAVSADGTVYIGVMDGSILAFDPSGYVKWSYLANGGIYGSPAIAADGSVCVQTIGGVLYGNLTCTPAATTPPSNLTVDLTSESSVHLSWQDNSSDEYGFVVQRKVGHSGVYADIAKTTGTTFDNTGLGSGITYYYRVCAYQEGGNSLPSNEVSVLTPGLPAPESLTAIPISGTRIDLAWSGLGGGELGYRIERMQGAAGPFRQIARVGSGVTEYSDLSVYPAMNYYYRVRAYDAVMNSSPSNEAWAATEGIDYGNVVWGDTTRRQMALTYDAGTAAIQAGLLNTLRDEQVYCNFYITGSVAQTQPALVKRIADEGHLVGNHSVDHPQFPFITDTAIEWQLETTDEILYAITGHRTRPWFRAPYGALNNHVLDQLALNGYGSAFWTVDCGDASWGADRYEQIARITGGAAPGALALSHCTVGETAAAAPTIIYNLRQMGYDLVTVPELIAPVQITYTLLPGWNLVSLPLVPANTTPMVVFRGVNISGGNMYGWDNETNSAKVFDAANPGAFGQINPDEGYWVYVLEPTTMKINGDVAFTERHIKLPQTLEDPSNGKTIIGYPFAQWETISHCRVYNPNAKQPKIRPFNAAVQAGWISGSLDSWDPVTQAPTVVGIGIGKRETNKLEPWHAYQITSHVNELEFIIPVP
jgi:outer membrane protein assembly factor BamB/peptidoglycan/xylan/chitin deacetylase (PgdA/CDA1 family)